ncbi:CAP domain-containing protein [Hutsoniella sourekii]
MKSHYRLAFVLATMAAAGVSHETVHASENDPTSENNVTIESGELSNNLPNTLDPSDKDSLNTEDTLQISQEIELNQEEQAILNKVEQNFGLAVEETVNNLRDRNGLNKLEHNDQLQVAAEKLVQDKPTGGQFSEAVQRELGDNPEIAIADQLGKEKAKDLVNNAPTHLLDHYYAERSGFNTKQGQYIAANHLQTTYILKDLASKNLEQVVHDIINRWFVDLSDPNHNHRNQMLDPNWTQTAVGVKINPLIKSGNIQINEMLDKLDIPLLREFNIDINSAYEINVTQYFGKTRKGDVPFHEIDTPVSLPTLPIYVYEQIGKEETNPNTNSVKKIMDKKEADEILGAFEIPQSDGDSFLEIPTDNWNKMLGISLLNNQNHDILHRPKALINAYVKSKISPTYELGSKNILSINFNGKNVSQQQIARQADQFIFSPIDYEENLDINRNYAKVSENDFSSYKEAEQSAIDFLKSSNDYLNNYFYLIQTRRQNIKGDLSYSVQFAEKKPLDLTSKIFLEKYVGKSLAPKITYGEFDTDEKKIAELQRQIESLLRPIKGLKENDYKIIVDIKDNQLTGIVRFKPDIPVVIENRPLNDLNIAGYPFDRDTRLKNYMNISDSEGMIRYLGDSRLLNEFELISAYREDFTVPMFSSKQRAENYMNDILNGLAPLPEYLAKVSSLIHSRNDLVGYIDDHFGWVDSDVESSEDVAGTSKPYTKYYAVIYPKLWSEYRDRRFKSSEEAHQFASERLSGFLWSITYDPTTLPDPFANESDSRSYQWMIQINPKQLFWSKDVAESNHKLLTSTDPRVYVTSKDIIEEFKKSPYRLIRTPDEKGLHPYLFTYHSSVPSMYHVFKMGDMYVTLSQNLWDSGQTVLKAYGDEKSAIQAGEKYLRDHPDASFDIFKFEGTYFLSIGRNRIESRWSPDNLSFINRTDAKKFADFISNYRDVKEFEYDIVPILSDEGTPFRQDNYRIVTRKILFNGDKASLRLILEYLYSGNSGVGGQHIETKNQLRKIADELRQKNVSTSKLETDYQREEEFVIQAAKQSEYLMPSIGGSPVYPSNQESHAPSTLAEVNQSVYQLGRLQVKLTPLGLSEVVQVLLEDYLEIQAKFKDKFAYLYNIQLIFSDISQEVLSEPAQAEILLKEGEEVDQVLRYDLEEDQVLEELEFEVIDDFDDQGKLVRKLVFEVHTSGYYGIILK